MVGCGKVCVFHVGGTVEATMNDRKAIQRWEFFIGDEPYCTGLFVLSSIWLFMHLALRACLKPLFFLPHLLKHREDEESKGQNLVTQLRVYYMELYILLVLARAEWEYSAHSAIPASFSGLPGDS